MNGKLQPAIDIGLESEARKQLWHVEWDVLLLVLASNVTL